MITEWKSQQDKSSELMWKIILIPELSISKSSNASLISCLFCWVKLWCLPLFLSFLEAPLWRVFGWNCKIEFRIMKFTDVTHPSRDTIAVKSLVEHNNYLKRKYLHARTLTHLQIILHVLLIHVMLCFMVTTTLEIKETASKLQACTHVFMHFF